MGWPWRMKSWTTINFMWHLGHRMTSPGMTYAGSFIRIGQYLSVTVHAGIPNPLREVPAGVYVGQHLDAVDFLNLEPDFARHHWVLALGLWLVCHSAPLFVPPLIC